MGLIHQIQCPYNCGCSFKGVNSKHSLKKHLTIGCGVNFQFQYPFCLKRFRRNANMKTHAALIHKSFI